MYSDVTSSKPAKSNKCTCLAVFGFILTAGLLSVGYYLEMFDLSSMVPSSVMPARNGSLLAVFTAKYVSGTRVSKHRSWVSKTKLGTTVRPSKGSQNQSPPSISQNQQGITKPNSAAVVKTINQPPVPKPDVVKNSINRTKGHHGAVIDLPDCNWPPPLYPKRRGNTPDKKWEVMEKIQLWFDNYKKDNVVFYLQSGGLLGLYRDGSLVPGDSDIDIRYGFKKNALAADKRSLLRMDHQSTISFNALRQWGDPWNGFLFIHKKGTTDDISTWDEDDPALSHHRKGVTDAIIDTLRSELCLPARSPLQTHKHARAEVEATYGPQWFIKMPFKSMSPETFFGWSKPGNAWNRHWRNCIAVMKKIDTNQDFKVTVKEIDVYVAKDGIDVEQYNRQILPRDRCRAAAILTYLLDYDKHPFFIKDDDIRHWHANHTLFTFPQCEKVR